MRRKRDLDSQFQKDIERMYFDEGMSYDAIGAEYGVTGIAIRHHLVQSPRFVKFEGNRASLTLDEMRGLRDRGMTLQAIATLAGVSRQAVHKRLK